MRYTEKLKNVVVSLYMSIRRFPVTLLFSTCAAIMLTIISEMSFSGDTDLISTLRRITMVLFLGVFLSLCIKFFHETYQNADIHKLVIYYIAGALAMAAYYLFFLKDMSMVSTSRYAAVCIALTAGFFAIPNLGRKQYFEIYTINIFKRFFITVIYTGVLYAGLSAIYFTVDKLLSVHVTGKVYYYTFLYVTCVFALSYFLAGVPKKGSTQEEGSYPKPLKILLLYIVMPLISAYTLILYIYFIKIIITGKWPVGMVSNLVLWYSIISAAVMFFITPIEKQGGWAKVFFTWLPRIILPLLVMMFVSIGIRINAYGVTEPRYYVILLGIWASGIMVYYWFFRGNRNIVLPVSIAIIALLSVFGPLSSYSVSMYSQNARFQKLLIKNKMLSDGKLLAATSGISRNDRADITSILYYFMSSHSLKEVKYLPDNFKIDDMQNTFGFAPESNIVQPGGYFTLTADRSGNVIDISGYQYMLDMPALYGKTGASGDINAVYDQEGQTISIRYKGALIYTKKINVLVEELVQKYNGSQKGSAVPIEEMTFTDENATVAVKFIFLNISGSKDSNTGETRVNGMDFYVLLRIK